MKNIYSRYILNLLLIVALFSSCKAKRERYVASDRKTFSDNLVKANRGLVTNDHNLISNYVAENGWNMKKTETGLWYENIKEGTGRKAEVGLVVHLRYQVKLINGKECYNSDSLGIKSFKIGYGGVESGLEEGVLLMREGGMARFILPPYLAFGLLGDENKIPPRSIIIYNVEMVKLTDN
jgi:FKBP-type peptidyl-prolyl cis-trans isomerase